MNHMLIITRPAMSQVLVLVSLSTLSIYPSNQSSGCVDHKATNPRLHINAAFWAISDRAEKEKWEKNLRKRQPSCRCRDSTHDRARARAWYATLVGCGSRESRLVSRVTSRGLYIVYIFTQTKQKRTNKQKDHETNKQREQTNNRKQRSLSSVLCLPSSPSFWHSQRNPLWLGASAPVE